jgi:2,4-dienoyl-CoA reductase-like NADH-dependent reductase (Old Yellow Enzyme family)
MKSINQHPLFRPATLGSHALRGRLVLPPMASGTADEGGRVTSKTLAHYDRIVGDRHALAWVEYTAVHPRGKSEPNQTMLCDEEHLPGLAALAALLRSKGVLAGIQLTHAGGKTDMETIGRAPLGASAVPIPAHGGDLPAPEPMTAAELAETAELARKLKAAGLNLLDVSSGLGGWRRQRDQRGEGYLVADALALREATGLPVIGVGRVSTLAYAAQALEGVDFLAVGRAMLENPSWPLAAAACGSAAA